MKKQITTLFTALLLTVCMTVPAFAAGAGKTYRAEASPVKAEIQTLNKEIKATAAENTAIQKTLTEARKARKAEKAASGKKASASSAEKETRAAWKKITGLMKELKQYKLSKEDKNTIKSLNASVKAAVKAKDFDTALSTLKQIRTLQETRLQNLESKNQILDQISALLK
jgi:vacuolar-type H+-ATPase subunit I/STV1